MGERRGGRLRERESEREREKEKRLISAAHTLWMGVDVGLPA